MTTQTVSKWTNIEDSNEYKSAAPAHQKRMRDRWFEVTGESIAVQPVAAAQSVTAVQPIIQSVQDSDSPDFIPGVKRGLQNLQATTYGAGALVGSGLKKLGAESVGQKLQDVGIEGYKRNIEEAKQYPKKHSFKDIYTGKTGVGGAIDWAQGTLGELVPSMVEAATGAAIGTALAPGPGTAAGGLAGRTVLKKGIEKTIQRAMKQGIGDMTEAQLRKQVTKQALRKFGGKVGIAGAVMPIESGGMYADLLEEKGIDAPETALLFGALATSLEFAGGNSKLVDTFVDALSTGAKGIVKKSAKEILTNIPQEALQEGGQELFGILNTVVNTDEKLLTADHVEQIIESMAAGAIGGGAGAVVQAGMANQVQDPGPEKTDQELILDKRASNILTQDKEIIDQSVQKLNDDIKSNQELLNDYQKLDAKATELEVEPTVLIDQILTDNNSNKSLIDKINIGLTEQEKLKQKEYENLSPEDKAVKDATDKLDNQRIADAQKINTNIKNLDDQAAFLTKQYQEEKDPVKKKVIAESIFTLRAEKKRLLEKVNITDQVFTKTPQTPTDEKQTLYDDLFGTVTIDEDIGRDAVESFKAFDPANELLTKKDQPYKNKTVLENIINKRAYSENYGIAEVDGGFIGYKKTDATPEMRKEDETSTAPETSPFKDEPPLEQLDQVEQPSPVAQLNLIEQELQVNEQQLDALVAEINATHDADAKIALQQEGAILYEQNTLLKEQLAAQEQKQEQEDVPPIEPSAEATTDSQFQVNEDQEVLSKVNLTEIEKAFPNQTVTQVANGTISVQFKNGQGLTINSIQDAGQGSIKLAIETGQMSKKGKILGITVGNEILLDENFADNKTLWHENKHVLDNLGMITEADNSALNKEFNKLHKQDKLEFVLSKHKDPKQRMVENRANMFAQIMVNREQYRNTPFGKTIQRVMDFFQQMFAFGKQSVAGLAREVESGKIYERQIAAQTKLWTDHIKIAKKSESLPKEAIDILESIPVKYLGNYDKNWVGKIKRFFTGSKVELRYHPSEYYAEYGELLRGSYDVIGNKITVSPGAKNTNLQLYILSHELGHMVYKNLSVSVKTGLDEETFAKQFGLYYAGKMGLEIPTNLKKLSYLTGQEDVLGFVDSKYQGIISDILSDNQGDPQFQVSEAPEQRLSQAEYDAVHAEKNNLLKEIAQQARIKFTEMRLLADKALGSISTRLKNVDPELSQHLRWLDFNTSQKIIDVLKTAKPLLDATKRMSLADKSDWNWARLNSDEGKIEQLAQKYNLTNDQTMLREKLNKIRQEAIEVGYDVGFIEEYWPRVIKDQEGFLQTTQEISQRPVFTEAIRAQAKKLGISQEQFEREFPEVKADIISNLILGQSTGIGGPGNIQSRIFETIPKEYAKFYMDADAALMQYVYSMTKKIEARKFFGKVPKRISDLKSSKKQKQVDLIKFEQLADMARAENPERLANYEDRIISLNDNLTVIDEKLNAYKLQRDYTENIGAYIDRLMVDGRIEKKDEKMVRDILDARFHEHGTHGIVGAYKNLSYIDTMGSPISAITQIGDLAWAMYVGKVWTPKGFSDTVKHATQALFKQSKITKEDLGIERIAQEFADGTTLSRGVSKVFKYVGLEKIDTIGKEVLINNALEQYKAQARANPKALAKLIRPTFGRKSPEVVQEILADNPSDNVKMLLYSRLLDFQPVALSEMPEYYLNSGNGRVFYMLKTYTLKQFDVFRKEVVHNLKSKNPQQKLQGITNMIQLMALLTIANATADEIKDFMLGKETKFSDNIIENFLTLGGASRFLKMQITREGFGSALSQQILPPTKFVNSASKDIIEGYKNHVSGDTSNFDHARIIDSIPGLGKLYYWHHGRGSDLKKSISEKEFTKASKDSRLFKKQLENSDDKRFFIESNLDRFKQMNLQKNFQAALNRNKAVINKLEKIPSTENIQTRLGQLKAQREQILKRYFEVADSL